MNTLLVILVAIAIPVVLFGLLALSLLFQNRVSKAAETFPDELKTKLGVPDKHGITALGLEQMIVVAGILALSQVVSAECDGYLHCGTLIVILGSIYWGWKTKVYLAARKQYAEILSADVQRVLLMCVSVWGLLSLLALGLSIHGIQRILETWPVSSPSGVF